MYNDIFYSSIIYPSSVVVVRRRPSVALVRRPSVHTIDIIYDVLFVEVMYVYMYIYTCIYIYTYIYIYELCRRVTPHRNSN